MMSLATHSVSGQCNSQQCPTRVFQLWAHRCLSIMSILRQCKAVAAAHAALHTKHAKTHQANVSNSTKASSKDLQDCIHRCGSFVWAIIRQRWCAGGSEEADKYCAEAMHAVFEQQQERYSHVQCHAARQKDGQVRTRWECIEMWPMQVPPCCVSCTGHDKRATQSCHQPCTQSNMVLALGCIWHSHSGKI